MPLNPTPGQVDTIIWDWNGTLIDDLQICVDTINVSLGKRHLPKLGVGKYREIFTFPVMDYYRRVGFDFSREPYDILANEFIERYYEQLSSASLFPDVKETLEYFRNRGMTQLILSAMEQDSLQRSVEHYGISGYFDRIQGADDIFAHGKIHFLEKLIARTGIDPGKTCMVGDTLHDVEVAASRDIPCVLVSRGHQSPARLTVNGNLVIPDLGSLVRFLNA